MAKFTICGRSVELDAIRISPAESSNEKAWLRGEYITVKLTQAVEGVRAHTMGRTHPGREASGQEGRWVAILDDDIIKTSVEYANGRALPGNGDKRAFFTDISWATLPVGCEINIGICAPIQQWGRPGGDFQAEYVGGERIVFHFNPKDRKHWHDKEGTA
jgi:hypothetical protein